MVAARVFDAFNDPIMGNVVEATRTRWGKFKPWIAIGGVLSVIVFITSFSTTLQGWAYVAAFGLLYFAYSVVFTMNDIAYWGMVPALARRAAGLHDGHPGGASVGCLFHLPCQIYDHGRIL